MYRNAFPDVQLSIEDQVAEGDKVVTRWIGSGTHQGEMMGIAPTGNQVRVDGMTISRIEDGKIVEEWEM
jgi:predicted ester cyclase